MPITNAIKTKKEPSSNIGDGNLTPRLLRNIESPIDRLCRTLGNANNITHQKIICKSTGTFRINSTYTVTKRLIRKFFDSLRIPAINPMIKITNIVALLLLAVIAH